MTTVTKEMEKMKTITATMGMEKTKKKALTRNKSTNQKRTPMT